MQKVTTQTMKIRHTEWENISEANITHKEFIHKTVSKQV